jgi:hypothetical protein
LGRGSWLGDDRSSALFSEFAVAVPCDWHFPTSCSRTLGGGGGGRFVRYRTLVLAEVLLSRYGLLYLLRRDRVDITRKGLGSFGGRGKGSFSPIRNILDGDG